MISLSAEQKNIEGIFGSITEQYIVPKFQRPYSWTFDQCSDLFKDLISAFLNKEPYFLGNIIIARSKEYELNGENYIIDGQQRLITIWILIKVLSLFLPNVNTLQSSLEVIPWSGNNREPKIKSLLFESKDNDAIIHLMSRKLEDIKSRYETVTKRSTRLKEEKCETLIEATMLYFYEQIINSNILIEENDLMYFAQFFMKRVTLLPIIQTADDENEATDRALTIFETINNRGLDLEDADIFKARLYDSTRNKEERDDFINLWVDLKSECNTLGLKIDDIFRYYSHIIRGKQGITTSEKNLRDFFTKETYSPILNNTYNVVLDDLNRILSILKYINFNLGVGDITKPGPWLQIINVYTNQYPAFAVVTYLYNNPIENEEDNNKFIHFLQYIIRYSLFIGSTTTVKFGIYSIITRISKHDVFNDCPSYNIPVDFFDHLGRLNTACTLLAYVLDTQKALPNNYTIDKIINIKDYDYLESDWQSIDLEEVINSIGNLVVLDIPKKNIYINEKRKYYSKSKLDYVKNIFKTEKFTYADWEKRNTHLKSILMIFFNISLIPQHFFIK